MFRKIKLIKFVVLHKSIDFHICFAPQLMFALNNYNTYGSRFSDRRASGNVRLGGEKHF